MATEFFVPLSKIVEDFRFALPVVAKTENYFAFVDSSSLKNCSTSLISTFLSE